MMAVPIPDKSEPVPRVTFLGFRDIHHVQMIPAPHPQQETTGFVVLQPQLAERFKARDRVRI